MAAMDATPAATGSAADDEGTLDNPSWHALTGPQAAFAEGSGLARRYRPEVSAFGAIVDESQQSWDELATLIGPGREIVLNRAGIIAPPDGWTTLGAGIGFQMVLDGEPAVGPSPLIRDLTEDDLDDMIALVTMTEPGPFRPRTFDLGGYRGIVEDGRLLAMAGQRVATATHVEISAVCTHPDARRRGYAALVTAAVARGIAASGRTPILHVAATNTDAKRVYEQLGFTVRTTLTFGAYVAPS